MKRLSLLLALVIILSCKKSNDNKGSGSSAAVTFTNNNNFPLRVIITGTGAADTLFPLPNRVLDFDLQPKSSIKKTDVPTGSRKLIGFTVCNSQQPVNVVCTGYVYRTVTYLPGQSYTEVIQ